MPRIVSRKGKSKANEDDDVEPAVGSSQANEAEPMVEDENQPASSARGSSDKENQFVERDGDEDAIGDPDDDLEVDQLTVYA